jgi:hypothetical protein
MPFTDSARNAALDAIGAAAGFATILKRDAATEMSGGSPAFARKAITWAAAATGQKASNAAVTFDMPPSSTGVNAAYFVSLRSAVTAGTDYGFFALGNQAVKEATFDATADAFTSHAHGYANGDEVALYANAGTVPTGYTANTVYYVVGVTTDTFQLSATVGGAAVNGTTNADVFVQKAIPESFGGQGQLTLPSGGVVLDAKMV